MIAQRHGVRRIPPEAGKKDGGLTLTRKVIE